ncbi:EAL domain-containing protein [Xanthobacteraceae bacterium Astr-EGSB]|uniref:putative bifunctional diguanylate cyclase/phosphodiesterase n=1 Tax=Astrobacterium formosum TaxID=3069710 RepID=UPI0027AE449D|nr:EAL domain-containing protein [Xanthobacteraceae bacterium Astr-EGSB]
MSKVRPQSSPKSKRVSAVRKSASGQKSLVRARAEAKAAIAEARRAHERLRDALDILPEGIVFLDADGRYILWNQQYADIYKRSADLFAPGARLADTLRIGVARGDYPEAAGREEDWIAERLMLLANPRGRHEQRLSDGRCILIEERRTAEGGVIGLRVDITEMKRREASFRLLFDANPVPMFVCALDGGRIVAANDAAVAHYGHGRDALLGMGLAELHDDGDLPDLADESADAAGRTFRQRKADGTAIDVALFSRLFAWENVPAALVAAVDITERKRAEARVAFMAHHDALTSLPNRVLLRMHMEEMLVRARRNGLGVATLCIDLDNFKAVNDTLGHPFGDLLLQEVAARLRSALGEHDMVARLGGDEFAVLHPDVETPAEVGALAECIIDVVSAPYSLDGHQVTIGASVGIAFAPVDADDADRLLKNADMALYRAKGDGKGACRFFEAEMDARLQARRRLEIDLRNAVAAEALEVHYQPLIALDRRNVSGFEALLRWRHPEHGMVPPSDFVPVAEETGLIGAIGAFVLRRACADAAKWPDPVTVAVNLSPLQFRNGALLQTVKDALERAALPPRRLELEITETVLLDRSDHVLATLHALRALGVRISMDDFGTGYSSLSYLRSFPFDKLKIDRSFVRDLGSNADSQAIVRAIIGLGESLGIAITAEGVENEADLACLEEEGCKEAQGFLFSRARPQFEVLDMLAAGSRRARDVA